MMRRGMKGVVWTMLLAGVSFPAGTALAQQAERYEIVNGLDHTYLTFRDGHLTGQAAPGPGAGWIIEPTGTPGQVRIKSALTGGYLHVQSGALEVGAIQPNAPAGIWHEETVGHSFSSFANAADHGRLLSSDRGVIAADPVQPGALKAAWRMEPMQQGGAAESRPQPVVVREPAPPRAPVEGHASLPPEHRPSPPPTQVPPPEHGVIPIARPPAAPPPPAKAPGSEYSSLPAESRPAPAPAPAATGDVKVYVVNRSTAEIDVFAFDKPGDLQFVASVEPGKGLPLQSPAGLMYRLAQNEQWVGVYRVGSEATQVISFPKK